MSAVTTWSLTPSDNNQAPPNGFPEGMAPSAVNNTARQIMSDIAREFQVNAVKVLASVAGTNTITGSMTPDLTSYSAGMAVIFTPVNNNTGATTLNIDSLGALDVQKADGDALISGDLVAGIPALLLLDSGADDFILLNPQASLAGQAITAFARYADTTANFTGTLQYGGVEVGYRGLPSGNGGSNVSGDYTLVAADAGKRIVYVGSGGHTITLPSSVLTIDSMVSIINVGSGSITLSPSGTLNWFNGSGTLASGSRTLAVAGWTSAYTPLSTAWNITGTGLS
jgi:hypothetical protein